MEFGSVDEIIKFAIGNEKDAVEFYTSLAKEATRASLKETFERFAQEEENHVSLLEDMAGNKEKIDSYEFAKRQIHQYTYRTTVRQQLRASGGKVQEGGYDVYLCRK